LSTKLSQEQVTF